MLDILAKSDAACVTGTPNSERDAVMGETAARVSYGIGLQSPRPY
jgi:hypothetical protein